MATKAVTPLIYSIESRSASYTHRRSITTGGYIQILLNVDYSESYKFNLPMRITKPIDLINEQEKISNIYNTKLVLLNLALDIF